MVELDAADQPGAADVDDGLVPLLQRGELLPEPLAGLRDLRDEPSLDELVEDGEAEPAGDRVASKCRSVVARLHEPVSSSARSGPRRGGRPPPSGLAIVTTSGTTPDAWNAKSVAGAPEAALDLVEDEDGARRVGGARGPCAGTPS